MTKAEELIESIIVEASDAKSIRKKLQQALGLPTSKAKWRGHKGDTYSVSYDTGGKGNFYVTFEGGDSADIISQLKEFGRSVGWAVIKGGKFNIKRWNTIPRIEYSLVGSQLNVFIMDRNPS